MADRQRPINTRRDISSIRYKRDRDLRWRWHFIALLPPKSHSIDTRRHALPQDIRRDTPLLKAELAVFWQALDPGSRNAVIKSKHFPDNHEGS